MPVTQIGRYRIVRPIGSGGMGQVYLGFDEELQRPVAVKGLLGSEASGERRARLRREALSVAALSHPAIAHLYEVISHGGRDWLVMEYVEGRSLANVLADGPLPPSEVARIGAEVADALSFAHAHGIIHRDVKAENVMITPTGHVKVLDFGLAKWTRPRGSDDRSLTSEGLVVGTAKAMSPEQAVGKALDPRSDIFSLGSLLYELASGKPAFHGGTQMETMHLVASCQVTPLRRHDPHLPSDLTRVIERCLAKSPGDRFANATEVADSLRAVAHVTPHTAAVVSPRSLVSLALRLPPRWRLAVPMALAAAALCAVAVGRGWLAPRKPLTIAVLPVSVGGSDGSAGLASAAVADAIAARLARLKGVLVVAGREVRAVAVPNKGTVEIARELGVDELIETSFVQSSPGAPARITLSRVDGASGKVTWTQELETGTDDLLLLQDRITTSLEAGYRGFSTASGRAARETNQQALGLYLEVLSRFDGGRPSKGFVEEVALLERAAAAAPHDVSVLTELAYVHRLRSSDGRDAKELALAEEALARAAALAPHDPAVLKGQVDLALAGRDSDRALDIAQAATRAYPGDSRLWMTLGKALASKRRFAEAERAIERAQALRPSWEAFWYLADMRVRRGDYAGTRRAVAELLARSPDNFYGLSKLAEAEMYDGHHKEAERLYRDLLARRGGRVDKIHLGNCLYYQTRYAEAEALYREAAEADPTDFLAIANLGDAQVIQGKGDLARANWDEALQLAEAGFASGDRDRSLLETRARCLAELGRGPEAVLAAQDAVTEYPDNPATLFTVAQVAAYNGDASSCIAWTRKALEANAPTIWFQQPEFGGMWKRPAFKALFPAP